MRHYIICIFLLAAIGTQAQQINPVPDYVFRNQMSVGRNAVTDTAAYISIGPRYGANKGLMPPIVSDTAAITGVKRNGLLIFSVQRNNFQYWDSINSRWTSVTANVDTTIISTRAWRKKGDDSLGAVIATRTDTTLLSTRAWRQKGLDSLAAIEIDGSGTVNYVPKFTATRTLGNSQIFDNGTNVGVGTASPWAKLSLGFSSSLSFGSSSFPFSVSRSASGNLVTTFSDGYDNSNARVDFTMRSGSANTTTPFSIAGTGRIGIGTTSPVYKLDVRGGGIFYDAGGAGGTTTYTYLNGQGGLELKGVTNENIRYEGTHLVFQNASSEQMRITSGGELLINTTTDVGDYRLQVNGNANFRDDVLIDTNLRVNRHISLDQTPKAWALGNAIEGPQGSTLFVAGGGVQTLANIYYDGSYKYSTSNPGAAMFLLQSSITFATYGSGTANGALTGANEMVYAGGELRVGIADQGTFKLQIADKSYFADEVQIASTTDLGNYKLQVTGEAIITAGIRTDAPSGGTAATWKLGTVATVSPTSPNRTIEVEIGGTTYYIHAKTTND